MRILTSVFAACLGLAGCGGELAPTDHGNGGGGALVEPPTAECRSPCSPWTVVVFPTDGPAVTRVLFEADEVPGAWTASCEVSGGVVYDSDGTDLGSCNERGIAIGASPSAAQFHVWAGDVLLYSGHVLAELRPERDCHCPTSNAYATVDQWPADPCVPLQEHWAGLGCEIDVALCDSEATSCDGGCGSGDSCVCRRSSAPRC